MSDVRMDPDAVFTSSRSDSVTIRRYPLTVESGEGCWLKTTDGQKYLDCVSGIATCALGHSNPALNDAVCKQMETMHHVSNLYFIPAQAALANWLCENSGADKVFFCNSGAEANEAAIKVARRHASNRGITVSFRNGSRFPTERAPHGRLYVSHRNLSLSVPNSPSMAAPWRP
jgi:acetylornithine/succinyldiaminopimelate/putrescine aminotransferase